MSRLQANLALLLAALLWGSGNVAQLTVLKDIGPLAAMGLRCLVAAAVILPFVIREGLPRLGDGREALKLMLLTSFSFAAASTIMQIAYGHTTVTNAGFLVNTTTVMMPFTAWVLLRQRPAFLVWPAGLTTLAGAFLMSGGGVSQFNAGDMLCLLSAVFFTLWMLFLGEFVMKFGSAGLLSLVQFAMTAAICLMLSTAIETTTVEGLHGALPELIYLGAVSTGAAYLIQGMAQRYTSACEAAIIVSAEALFGALGGFLLLGETLSALGGIGAALIATGILLVQIPPEILLKLIGQPPVSYRPVPVRSRESDRF